MASVSRAIRDEGIRHKRGECATVREIARAVGLSDRQVRNVLARPRG